VINEALGREFCTLNELSAEVVRLRDELTSVEKIAVAEWLRVAAAHSFARGGHVGASQRRSAPRRRRSRRGGSVKATRAAARPLSKS
jgi:hypothetical protein